MTPLLSGHSGEMRRVQTDPYVISAAKNVADLSPVSHGLAMLDHISDG